VVNVAEQQFRLRIKYIKAGRLAQLSHLETTRALERAIRRSGLPYAISHGFNAHMRLAFGPALPVGTGSLGEYIDVTLSSYLPAPRALAALQAASHPGLMVQDVNYITPAAKALTVTHIISTYEIRLNTAADVQAAVDSLLDQGMLTLIKKGKPKEYKLSDYLVRTPQCTAADGCTMLRLTLRATPTGSLRPEQILASALEEGTYQVLGICRVSLEEE
jgi:radical SAM-linked protein